MSISGKIVGTLGIAVAGLAATNVVYTLSDSPAFVEAARVDGVYGDWRLKTGPALYDRSEYLFQLGYGYITADGSFTAVTENIGELADVDTGIARGEQAIALISESLKLSPGNAHAWGELALAQLSVLEYEGALASLRTSWQMAPFNASLALKRLQFAEVITAHSIEAIEFDLAELAPPSFNDTDLENLKRDLTVAQTHRPRQLDGFFEWSVHTEELLSDG